MSRGIRRAVASWLGVAGLLCQILLPFGHNPVAELLGLDCPGLVAAQPHHHHESDDLANPSGGEQPLRHSHHERKHSCPICLDLQYATPLTIVDPPALAAVGLHWVAFVADWMAPAPSAADTFSRPLPRAPPLPA